MDRMAWNEELGKLVFQFKVALTDHDLIAIDFCFALNLNYPGLTFPKSH